MAATRHRRDVPRRTVIVGSLLAVALGLGLLALGLVPDAALRPVLMGVLLVAVFAGVLAIDEARLAEGRTDTALSRERARSARNAAAWAEDRQRLRTRIDDLERDLAEVRRAALRPRALVVVAEPRPAARVSRILEIPDVVPAPSLDTEDVPVVDVTVLGEFSLGGLSMFPRPAGMPESFPPVDAPSRDEQAEDAPDADEVIDLRARQGAARRMRPA